ncbi:hypothetical protein CPSG_00966 [Coccidioides posadasii str. Silveira]|uniref:Uncharacterized protein n=1 Tax=Coccidioides posadasii (strain RMSCC 757 / Silveira) TaxID=443226 RepID=E9CU31_COCPS|nr:hypothetical protein CPSG_00966 [Coccidioides posadasii str. Silveira]
MYFNLQSTSDLSRRWADSETDKALKKVLDHVPPENKGPAVAPKHASMLFFFFSFFLFFFFSFFLFFFFFVLKNKAMQNAAGRSSRSKAPWIFPFVHACIGVCIRQPRTPYICSYIRRS